MTTLVIVLATALVTWFVLTEQYKEYYSPKARIKRLWNEISLFQKEIAKYQLPDPVATATFTSPFQEMVNKKKMMIKALLDYHFDPDDDSDFISENTP